jgi:hypothetical protein
MRKLFTLLCLMTISVLSTAQTARLSLYEEFTGENCGPCASTNPGLQTVLDANTSKAVSIKWEVPIPTAPSATWSLYQTNKAEIDWRYRSTASGGYGYPSQNTPTNSITSGINSAPSGRIDGQHQWTFGALSDHPANLSGTHLSNAQAISSPFSIIMTRAWDPGFTTVTVTVSITAAQNFTCTGPLIFRLVMVEQEIHYTSAPGSNGEKDFYNAARRSFPTLQGGTSLPSTWTSGQNQTFTISCPLPPNIVYKPMVNMIGFIQDDATRLVHQAAKTTTMAAGSNDAKAQAFLSGSYYNCGTSFTPSVSVTNMGGNAITTMTILPIVDGIAQAPFAWSGSLASGATGTITMPVLTPTLGAHTYSFNITSVNGSVDTYTNNNTKYGTFALTNTIIAAPIVEPFTTSTFPPANWYRNNQDNGIYQFARIPTVGAYAIAPLGAVKYDSWNNPVVGDRDELYMPNANFTGLTNMKLTFDVAHAMVDPSVIEGLDVLVSTNCGATWTNVYSKYGSTLASAPIATVAFTPSGSQWRSETVNLSVYDNMPQVLVKFMPYNAYGNNIWLDNINLVSTTNITTTSNAFDQVELYPNPAQNETNLKIFTSNAGEANISILNSIGQLVSQKTTTLENGNNVISIDTKHLSEGIYHVVIADRTGASTVKKLTISK